MMSALLDEQRCEKCSKLLFRGMVGIGFIEVKCARCGHINLLNSYDAMLHGTPGAYILVYDRNGRLIAGSNSAESTLGYSAAELQKQSMQKIDEEFDLSALKGDGNKKFLEQWEQFHKNLPHTVTHKTKNNKTLRNYARYYPIGSLTGVHTIGIFYTAPA
jgi:phage FluMu protein Com